MSDVGINDLIVFYAWQGDLPTKANKNIIRLALREASSRVENEFAGQNLHVILDEATRDEPGSPNIPATILEKITVADIFVCDVTTVNRNSPDSERKMPNPNVVFELGFAVSRLGWGRVVMLFNEEFGNFPHDMPFDFDRHRASPYTYALPKANQGKKLQATLLEHLVKLLCSTFRAIITSNPQKPFYTKDITNEQKKKIRDVAKLNWLMSKVHIPTLETHIREIPYKIYDSCFFFWEDFNAVVMSGLFYLYDEDAKKLISEIRDAWDKTLSFGEHYHSQPSQDVSFFSNPVDMPLNERQQKDWDTILASGRRLDENFRKLLEHIRENYLEINLNELSSNACDAYIEYEKEISENLEQVKNEK